MIVLGFNFSHDGAVAAVRDGRLVAAIGTERLTRRKKAFGVTEDAVRAVLREAGATLADVTHVAMADYLSEHNHGILELIDSVGHPIVKTNYTLYHNDVRWVSGRLLGRPVPAVIMPHQLAHAAATFYTSPFDQAATLTVDSSFGEMGDNSLICQGQGTQLTAIRCPNLMSGIGYAVFTELLGFEPAYAKAGTTMGLSSYGRHLLGDELDELVRAMRFHPRRNAELEYRIWWSDLWQRLIAKHPHELDFRESSNLAATVQALLQHSILDVAASVRDGDGATNLCLGGGSLLNVMTNTELAQTGWFDCMHHFPACGDDGNAVGSALYVAHHLLGHPRQSYQPADLAYLGPSQPPSNDPPFEAVAKLLAEGKIVCWYQGRSEFGPRALGNRSILADPRSYHTRERINFAIKHREWFRPVAPAVMEEHARDWFDLPLATSPYMLYTAQVLRPELIPAATHVDGTARPQTVNRDSNPRFYQLLHQFHQLTGVPVLINTSLNGAGEPIAETADEAEKFFRNNTSVDAAVINDRVIERTS